MKNYLLVECPDQEHAVELQKLLKNGADGDCGFSFDDWCAEFGESVILTPDQAAKVYGLDECPACGFNHRTLECNGR